MEQEKSANGQPIYRYEDIERNDFTPAFGDIDSIDAISDHVEKYIGTVDLVFHELVSDKVHIDVHWVKPTEKYPYNTLVTSGMSDLPMTIPEGYEGAKYAELCVILPEDWTISEEAFNDEKNYWPIRWLKMIARLPHDYNSWVGYGHTIPNGEDAAPFSDNTKMGCILLLPAVTFDEDFAHLKINEEKTINFYCLIPLYKEEMNYKLDKGCDALLEQFEKHQITDVVAIDRENTCKKKGLFGLW